MVSSHGGVSAARATTTPTAGLDIIKPMTRMEYRGPFLLLYALNQQLDSLLSSALTDSPLRPGEFAVHSALRLEQPTTPSELAQVLGLRPTTMSSQLAKMARAGHLERTRNPNDGRSALISLTPEGMAATEACFPAFQDAIMAFRRHLQTDEATGLAVLEEYGAALAHALADLPPAGGQAPRLTKSARPPGPASR